MYSWSDNKEIMTCEETDKIIVELFVSLLSRKHFHIFKRKFEDNYAEVLHIASIYNLSYKIPKKIPVFHSIRLRLSFYDNRAG